MTDTSVPQETWRQLGGNRFAVMTGAKHPLAVDDRTLSFQLPQRMAKNGANRVTIELTPMDVYTVRFWKVRKAGRSGDFSMTQLSEHPGIYCDALRQCFERETGLATSLGIVR